MNKDYWCNWLQIPNFAENNQFLYKNKLIKNIRSDGINTSFIWNTIIQQTHIQKTENRFFRMVKDKQKKQAEDKNSLFKKYTVKNDQYILNNVEQTLLIISEIPIFKSLPIFTHHNGKD